MAITDVHNGKRIILQEKEIDTEYDKIIYCALTRSSSDNYNSVIHIQKSKRLKSGDLEPLKGGIMIDVKLLPALKAVVDQFYMRALSEGMI